MVLNPDINFSDHVGLPLAITVRLPAALNNLGPAVKSKRASHNQRQLRWDKADLNSFYSHSYDHLSAVLDHINELSSAYEPNAWSDRDCCGHIDTMYNRLFLCLITLPKLMSLNIAKFF